MKKAQKGFIALLVVVAMLVVGGGIYYYQKTKASQNLTVISAPSAQDVSNWKAYTNTQYGYQLQYPQDWTITKSSSGQIWINEPTEEFGHHIFTIGVLEGKISDILSSGTYLSGTYIEREVYTSQFVQGMNLVINLEDGSTATSVFVEHNGKIYTLTNETDEQSKIISTFKFIQ